MFASKPNYLKLRTNLRLCINRLKLLEKKKTELALKARREIADYILAGKDDRARIRVEHIIREDYLVEAMEIVEMLCDLLLARFGLIEKMSELDPGIEEAIATLIWVAPRLSGDIQEIREVAHQLTIKYGKEFGEMCRRNTFESVNEKVVHKMSLAAPPKILVEHYMIEIARTYKVTFEPDPLVMMGQPPEVSNLIDLGIDALSPSSGIGTSGSGSTAAHLKAMEAGHVVGGGGGGGVGRGGVGRGGGGGGGGGGGPGGQLVLPDIPGSVGSLGLGYGPGGGGSGGYTAGGTNNGFPGPGVGGGGGGGFGYSQAGGGNTSGAGFGYGSSGGTSAGAGGVFGAGGSVSSGTTGCVGGSSGYTAGGTNNGFPGPGVGGGGGGGFGYSQPGGGNTSGAGFGYGSSGGTSTGAGGVFGTGGSVSSGTAGYVNSGQGVAGSAAFGTTGDASSSGDVNPLYENIGRGGAAAGGIDGFPGGMGSGRGNTKMPGRNDADYSAALIGGVPVLPSEGQFPPPVPEGYLPPSGTLPSSTQPRHLPDTNPVDVPRTGPGTAGRAPMNPQMSWINDDYLPSLPPYEQVVNSPNQYPTVQPGQRQPTSGADGMDINRFPDIPSFPDVPGLPSVPSNSLGGASVGGDDVDFDDLARRFEELKRRK